MVWGSPCLTAMGDWERDIAWERLGSLGLEALPARHSSQQVTPLTGELEYRLDAADKTIKPWKTGAFSGIWCFIFLYCIVCMGWTILTIFTILFSIVSWCFDLGFCTLAHNPSGSQPAGCYTWIINFDNTESNFDGEIKPETLIRSKSNVTNR